MPERGHRIAVTAAMREEIEPLAKRLEDLAAAPDGAFALGRLSGAEVALTITGAGWANAERGLTRLLESFRPDRILVLGIGGGLTPDLEIGDLILAEEVRDRGTRMVDPDPDWLAAAADRTDARTGSVVSVAADEAAA